MTVARSGAQPLLPQPGDVVTCKVRPRGRAAPRRSARLVRASLRGRSSGPTALLTGLPYPSLTYTPSRRAGDKGDPAAGQRGHPVRRQPPARRPLHRDHQARACAALPGALSLLGACMRQPPVEGHGPGACRVWGFSLAPATTPLRIDSKAAPGRRSARGPGLQGVHAAGRRAPPVLWLQGAAAPARGARRLGERRTRAPAW